MIVKSFYSLSVKEQDTFFNWLKNQKNNDPAYENMWADDWKDKPNTLPFILSNTNKYANNNGDFNIVYDGKKIAACAAIYKASFNSLVAIAGVRTWVAEEYRNQLVVREYLLPAHKQWAIDNNCKQIALTFNEEKKARRN
jgi:hypothetical protein